MDINTLAQAELTIATTIYVQLHTCPGLAHLVFPGGQHTGLFIAAAFDLHPLLNLWDVETRRILLHHARHAEGRGTGANRLFHHCNPAVRNAVRPSLVVSGY